MERQMTAVDVQAYLRDVKDRIMDARVIALVEEDLEHGLMPGEINDYTDRCLLPRQIQTRKAHKARKHGTFGTT